MIRSTLMSNVEVHQSAMDAPPANLMNQGMNRMNYILTGGGIIVNPVLGAGIMAGLSYTNAYLNHELCGGPTPC